MARINLTQDQIRDLRQLARSRDRVPLKTLLVGAVQYGLPLKWILETIRPPWAVAKDLHDNAQADLGFDIEIEDPQLWVELDPAGLDVDMPGAFAPDVVVKPASDDTPEETRPRKWSEAFMLTERDGRYFAPVVRWSGGTTGSHYLPMSKAVRLIGRPSVIGLVHVQDLPQPTTPTP